MKNQASRERWKNKGFTFLELLVTWAVVGIGITSLSMVISRDISTLTRGRSDQVAQAWAMHIMERISRYDGYDVVSAMPALSTQLPTAGDPAELFNVPWIRERIFVQDRSVGVPQVKLVTVVVDLADSVAAGNAGNFRSYRLVTLVTDKSFDKTPS